MITEYYLGYVISVKSNEVPSLDGTPQRLWQFEARKADKKGGDSISVPQLGWKSLDKCIEAARWAITSKVSKRARI